MKTVLWASCMLSLCLTEVSAEEIGGLDGLGDIEDLDLADLLDAPVTTATKKETAAERSPAVVSVITAEELRTKGYASLAEVLRTVPGFYDIHDMNTHNFGVRGVNGGARASGGVLKLLIDGQSVQFHTNTGNFFAEELIPIQVVERVEIIRGPASALYGANAFLGVVNVITKTGKAVDGFKVIGSGTLVRENLGYGGGFIMGGGSDGLEMVVGVSESRLDRSGLALADSSPVLQTPGSRLEGLKSENDISKPRSIFAKASVGSEPYGQATVWASVQRMQASGEFLDFEPLTHEYEAPTTISVLNQHYRLTYALQAMDELAVKLSGTVFDSSPTDEERLNTGRSDEVLLRDAHVGGWEVSAEVSLDLLEIVSMVLGADYQTEHHNLQSYDKLLLTALPGANRAAGEVIPGAETMNSKCNEHEGHCDFQNAGVFLQVIADITSEFSATAGLRFDYHNIYEQRFSPRAALVYVPEDLPFHIKLLYGSSFKAPSAEQLFTQPIRRRDVQGNESLKAQTAQTGELAAGIRLGELGQMTASFFVTDIKDRVEYLQEGLFQTAQNNLTELLLGGELEARLLFLDWLGMSVGVGIAKSVEQKAAAGVVAGEAAETSQPLFPVFQAHLSPDFRLSVMRFSPELSIVSPRAASQSNALSNGENYETDWFINLGASVAFSDMMLLKDRSTDVALRATNLLNTGTEPGFGGIDYPMQGLTVFMTIAQEL